MRQPCDATQRLALRTRVPTTVRANAGRGAGSKVSGGNLGRPCLQSTIEYQHTAPSHTTIGYSPWNMVSSEKRGTVCTLQYLIHCLANNIAEAQVRSRQIEEKHKEYKWYIET